MSCTSKYVHQKKILIVYFSENVLVKLALTKKDMTFKFVSHQPGLSNHVGFTIVTCGTATTIG